MTSVILNDGGVPVYPTLSAFPSSSSHGALAVNQENDTVYEWDGSAWIVIGPGGAGIGTVTSVGLSMPSIFNVSGSPVTTAGTLTASLANEVANTVFAGPSSGSDSIPTFRTLVLADLPAGVSDYAVNEFTLSPTDISNGFVTLSTTPINPTLTLLNVIGGPMQDYGVDFSVSGSTFSWSGLGLDGVLESSDKLYIQFY